MGGTELWSSVFDPILSALLSDLDRDILLRWLVFFFANEVVRTQPDAIICQVNQLSWGIPLGYGEATLEETNPNIDSLANDLLRLAIMNFKAISKSKMSDVLGFQIHGYNLKVYLTQKMPNSPYYTITEVLAITFSKSIQELDSLTSRANIESLLSFDTVFWTICCNKHDV
ncbi:hypothetical protein BJV82DRAFT_690334 [Fennellomyces sp. T-0311]|nr:hypothetical protein BJV82DRAFT_690334 [Fennellomyces sp. T-0311]